ncbi:MAG: DUF2939 domain-containing protein [Roseateles asaccharophilus]|uniref:DUF2939 domain-containing protein n=1 Tax=Roseateles asaccharophilus TaxID=582607 RepID=UPI00391C4861
MSKTRRPLKTALLALALVAGLALYATPYLTVHQLREAARERDAQALAAHVDFPALRQHLKLSVQDRLAGRERNERGDPTPAAAMGAAVAAALLGPMVDVLITPETLGRILQGESPLGLPGGREPPTYSQEGRPRLLTEMGYESPGRFVFSLRREGDGEEPIALVLHRQGLIGWRLAEMRLP